MSKTFRRVAFAFVAAAAVVGIAVAAAPEASAEQSRSCVPTCFKNPITGQITCTYPCP